MKNLLQSTTRRAVQYLAGLEERSVGPAPEALAQLDQLGGPLPEQGESPEAVLDLLDRAGSPATVASAGPRYFGFVTGGSLPAALAANWLAGAWDQNAAMEVSSPAAARLESIALAWLLDVLQLPDGTAAGFVSGATMANFVGLAAGRHAVLAQAGWDVEGQGLFGAPEIQVMVGEEVHVSLIKALGLLGLGRDRVVRVPVDTLGRMRAEAMPRLELPAIVCLQAGNVNTGAFDPASEIVALAKEAGAWVHVDGAFGLWAAASKAQMHLIKGYAGADSWATDAHKWLNVPYDSGIAFCRQPEVLQAAMATSAGYLQFGGGREPSHFTPELSRRARGVEVWAALRSLGRRGLEELIERNCRLAARFAHGLRAHGFVVLNDVVLNQVLVSFGDPETTRRMVAAIQAEGTLWAGGTVWQGRQAMRISVSSWVTTDDDVDRGIQAVERIYRITTGQG